MSEALEGIERKDKPLSLEEFSRENTNNFWLHFVPEGLWGPAYQSKFHYQKFKEEQPELEARLLAAYAYLKDEEPAIGGTDSTPEERKRFEEQGERKTRVFEENKKDLYEAYLAMRTYAKNDWELFQ